MASIFLLILVAISITPERSAKLLVGPSGWTYSNNGSNKVALGTIPAQFRHVRKSEVTKGGVIFRAWTPDKGIVPLNLKSPPFVPSKYMSVPVTGGTYTHGGTIDLYMECLYNHKRISIFQGSVNVNVNEAIVSPPPRWCRGKAKIVLDSFDLDHNIGVGQAYSISFLSYIKQSFIGRLVYFFSGFFVFSYLMFSGTAIAVRKNPTSELLPIAFITLGLFSLLFFYLYSAVSLVHLPEFIRIFCYFGVFLIGGALLVGAGSEARGLAWRQLAPYGKAWLFGSLLCYSIGNIGYNGLGHWGPNYEFWPASWISDNELPWMFAEALRNHWGLKNLFGGGWLPTDRPPLMVGSHLLVGDIFGWLQINNDGHYLRGEAYNAAAALLGTLWIPAVLWMLKSLAGSVDKYGRILIVLFIGSLPFIFFNGIYGWPKAYGAAYALVAFGVAGRFICNKYHPISTSESAKFFVLGAWSLLCHMSGIFFFLPLAALYLPLKHKNGLRQIAYGATLCIFILSTWSVYKFFVLPTSNVLPKYALAGNFGFDHASKPLLHLVISSYRHLGFMHWLKVKWDMLLQVFVPINNKITSVPLNQDYGASTIDKLRAWDFVSLSRGNIAIPFVFIITCWSAVKLFRHDNFRARELRPFFALVFISLSSWLIIVAAFLIAPVLHIWAQAAIFGLALGGAVIAFTEYPRLFFWILFFQLIYFYLVWIISPINHALNIDYGAATVFAILILGAVVNLIYANQPIKNRTNLI